MAHETKSPIGGGVAGGRPRSRTGPNGWQGVSRKRSRTAPTRIGRERSRRAAEATGTPLPGWAGSLRLCRGNHELKGFHVLMDALSELRARSGWRIEIFGIGAEPHALRSMHGLPIRLSPAFPPDGLSDVLRRTDVLVIPSVIRESFSLLTREALQAGVPVIVTDSLGPKKSSRTAAMDSSCRQRMPPLWRRRCVASSMSPNCSGR